MDGAGREVERSGGEKKGRKGKIIHRFIHGKLTGKKRGYQQTNVEKSVFDLVHHPEYQSGKLRVGRDGSLDFAESRHDGRMVAVKDIAEGSLLASPLSWCYMVSKQTLGFSLSFSMSL